MRAPRARTGPWRSGSSTKCARAALPRQLEAGALAGWFLSADNVPRCLHFSLRGGFFPISELAGKSHP